MIKIIGREYKEEYEEKYALIIGISNYKYANSLGFKLNRILYGVPAFAWTVKNEKQQKRAKKYFDTMIFDSFVPKHRRH